MDDNTKNIITLCISGYAALVSTISLSWNIINSIMDKKSRVKITWSSFVSTFSTTAKEEVTFGAQIFSVSIVNSSKKIKYINDPKFKLSYKIKFGSTMVNEVHIKNLSDKRNWPIELRPEEEIVLNYSLRAGTEWFLKDAPKRASFKIMIEDTVNKKYFSKRIKIEVLKNIVKYNNKIPIDDYLFSAKVF